MPPPFRSLENPFEPQKPRKKDEAEFVGRFLGPEAEEEMRKLVGKPKKEEPKEDWGEFELSEEEKKKIEEEKEKEKPWNREQVIEWAETFGKNEEWVNETFTFDPDGTIRVEGDLALNRTGIDELPKGIKEVKGYLDLKDNQLTSLEGLPKSIGGTLILSYNKLTSLEGLPESIGGDLDLFDIPATTIPEGLNIGGEICVYGSQSALIEDAERKGYKVEVL